jgi:hypothetical protein
VEVLVEVAVAAEALAKAQVKALGLVQVQALVEAAVVEDSRQWNSRSGR